MGGTECDNCKKRFGSKEVLNNHQQKCVGINIKKYEDEHKCKSCSKTFSSLSNLKYHMKNQHMAIDTIKEQNGHDGKQIVNNIINNITKNKNITKIGTQNNININAPSFFKNIINISPSFVKHGDETVDHITKEFLLKLLDNNSSQKMFVDLMATLYFSEEVPENNNWNLAYPYNDSAAITFDYDKNEFKRTSTEQTINEKFSNMIDKIVPMIDEINKDRDKLSRNQQLNIAHFYDKECMYDLSKSCPDIYELIRKLAYEQRSIPMKTWKNDGFDGKHLSISFDKNNKVSQFGEFFEPHKTI